MAKCRWKRGLLVKVSERTYKLGVASMTSSSHRLFPYGFESPRGESTAGAKYDVRVSERWFRNLRILGICLMRDIHAS